MREDDRFRALMDTAANVIVALRPNHTIFEWNHAATKLFGVAREDAIGTDYLERFLPAEQRAAVASDIQKVLAGTPTYGFEDTALLPDGTRRTLLWNVTRLVDSSGVPEGILAIGQDISERTEAERLFRLMFERSADGLLLARVPSGVVKCNQAALDLLGLDTFEQLRDRHVATFSPPTQPDGVPSAEKSRQMDALAIDRGFHRFEWLHLDAAGAPLPMEVSLSYLGQDRGEPLFLVTWHDLRAQKRAEAERAQLEERLRHAERLEVVGRFAGGIAHDFNNLLTVVDANLDLLRLELRDAGLRGAEQPSLQLVEEVAGASGRAQALVKQLLAFSRKQPTLPQRVVVGDLVRRAERLLRRVIGDEVTLKVEVDDEDAAVLADPAQLEQVLMNLAVNARDAMLEPGVGRPRGGHLHIRVDRDAGSPGHVRLVVADNGGGMSPEVQARAFEPFFTTKALGKGTGLGLSTVHGLVEQAGGVTRIESAPGAGTRVTVVLPACDDEAPRAADEGGATSVPVVGTRGLRVLLVEDTDGVREVTRRLLVRAGYDVDVASDGDAGLRRVGERAYDLVVTDLRMPGKSGVELASLLRAERPSLPVVFLTGYATEEIPEALRAGTRTLLKPFRTEDLLEAIEGLSPRRS
ncbi:MAG: PAS domain S-box protein [Myxococcaceae bacterium]|nr:PAS domain S-box protein [Myxococcaceae bacterium]